MGADQSKIGTETVRHAFHVLRVDEGSPAAHAKLFPYFDYIVSVNGVEILQEIPNVVSEMAKNHIDRPMKMTVYNSRRDALREVTIVPSRNWGGKTLLGTSIRYCQVTDAADRVWHVIDVTPNSPAHSAGLVPLQDWIIGSPDIAINTTDDFYNLMIHNQKRPVRLLVFNLDREAVRETSVTPDFEWGGEGCLGCDVASGALHRIAPPQGAPGMIEAPRVTSEPSNNFEEASLTAATANNRDDVVVIDSPKPVQPIVTKATNNPPSSPVASSSTINVKNAQANLQPIPGFGGATDQFQDLSFLQ